MSVKRHTAYNMVGAAVPLLGTFVTLPIYLRTIGEERYGVLIVLWTLLGYFGLFDLGLGRAVTNRIAALREQPSRVREEVFWTALIMNLALGFIGSLLLWGVGIVLFPHFAAMQGPLGVEAYQALPWMVLGFPLLLATSVMTGALMGREEFLFQNIVNVGTGLLVQVVPLVVALVIGPTLSRLVLAVIGVRVLSGLSLFVLCVHRLPVGWRPVWRNAHIRPLFGFGGWITVTSIVSPLLDAVDRIVIGAILGGKYVSYYSVPFGLASRISILPGSLAAALFPKFSSLEVAERESLHNAAVRSLVAVLTPAVVAGVLVMRPFLTVWLGPEFAQQAALVGEIIVIGLWANCLAYLPYVKIQGQGRPDIVAKIHLIEVLPYLILLWVALRLDGVRGAAIVWSTRAWADAVLMFWASHLRPLRLLVFGVVVLAGTEATAVLTLGTGWKGLVVRGTVILAVCAGAVWKAPSPLRVSFYRLLRRSNLRYIIHIN